MEADSLLFSDHSDRLSQGLPIHKQHRYSVSNILVVFGPVDMSPPKIRFEITVLFRLEVTSPQLEYHVKLCHASSGPMQLGVFNGPQ